MTRVRALSRPISLAGSWSIRARTSIFSLIVRSTASGAMISRKNISGSLRELKTMAWPTNFVRSPSLTTRNSADVTTRRSVSIVPSHGVGQLLGHERIRDLRRALDLPARHQQIDRVLHLLRCRRGHGLELGLGPLDVFLSESPRLVLRPHRGRHMYQMRPHRRQELFAHRRQVLRVEVVLPRAHAIRALLRCAPSGLGLL